MMQTILLEVENLRVSYGGIQALKGISLTIAQGELVTLIGSNGAGKTTTLKTLAGLLHPASGKLNYQDKPLQHVPAHQRVVNGIALVPEGRGIFARLTVEENLLMGAYIRSDEQKSPPTSNANTNYSRAWPNAARNLQAHFPAANNKWSPWRAR